MKIQCQCFLDLNRLIILLPLSLEMKADHLIYHRIIAAVFLIIRFHKKEQISDEVDKQPLNPCRKLLSRVIRRLLVQTMEKAVAAR